MFHARITCCCKLSSTIPRILIPQSPDVHLNIYDLRKKPLSPLPLMSRFFGSGPRVKRSPEPPSSYTLWSFRICSTRSFHRNGLTMRELRTPSPRPWPWSLSRCVSLRFMRAADFRIILGEVNEEAFCDRHHIFHGLGSLFDEWTVVVWLDLNETLFSNMFSVLTCPFVMIHISPLMGTR